MPFKTYLSLKSKFEMKPLLLYVNEKANKENGIKMD